jgi:hypothetical protein
MHNAFFQYMIGILLLVLGCPVRTKTVWLLRFGGDFTTEFSTKKKGFNKHVPVKRATSPPLTAISF